MKVFMTAENTQKIYHIYAKGECIYHSLSEEEFANRWKELTQLVEITGKIGRGDLEYEELTCDKILQEVSY